MKQNKLSLFKGLTYFLFIILTNFDQALGMEDQEMPPPPPILKRTQSDPGTGTLVYTNPLFKLSPSDLELKKSSKKKSPRERTKNARYNTPPIPIGRPASPRATSISSPPGSPKGKPSHAVPPLPTGRPASPRANSISSPPGSPRGRGRSRSGSSPRDNISAKLIKKSEPIVLASSPRGGQGFVLPTPEPKDTPKLMACPGLDAYQLHYKETIEKEAFIRKQISAPSLSQASQSPRHYLRRAKSDPQTIHEKKQGLQEKEKGKEGLLEAPNLVGSPESNPSQRSNPRERRKRSLSIHTGRSASMIPDILAPLKPDEEKDESVSN